MTWPEFAAPGAGWLFLLVAPLVALYFLKLRRPRTQVTSLVLWRQLLEDQRVNSPFQRFKRNLLLLLQLLLLLLVVLAAMQPFVRAAAVDAERTLVLLDRSASMGAREREGGPTRLDVARERLGKWIGSLRADQQLAILTFDRTARLVAPFTSDRRDLARAVDGIEVAPVGSDLGEALRMAEAMSRANRIDRVVLLSDGNLPGAVDVDLPFSVDFQKLPPGGRNLGISELTARREPGQGWRVFARVDGSLGGEQRARLEWLVDDEPRGTESVVVTAGRGQRLVVPLDATARARIEVRLRPEGFDALDSDDVAFLELEPPRELRAWVSPRLTAHRRALEVQDGVVIEPPLGSAETEPTGLWDLIVVDRPDTGAGRALVALHDGAIPAPLAALVEREEQEDEVVDWSRDAPLLEHVDLAELYLGHRVAWAEGAGIGDVERQRFEVLAHGRRGPLVVQRAPGYGETDATYGYWILFDSARSTLPYRIAFPVMLANLVRQAARRAGLLEAAAVRTGVLPPMQITPGEAARVVGPDGSSRAIEPDAAGLLTGVAAREVGLFEVWSGGERARTVGVALLDARETRLDTVDEFAARELTVVARLEPVGVDRSLVGSLVWVALGVLLVEWWFAQRRPGGAR